MVVIVVGGMVPYNRYALPSLDVVSCIRAMNCAQLCTRTILLKAAAEIKEIFVPNRHLTFAIDSRKKEIVFVSNVTATLEIKPIRRLKNRK